MQVELQFVYTLSCTPTWRLETAHMHGYRWQPHALPV